MQANNAHIYGMKQIVFGGLASLFTLGLSAQAVLLEQVQRTSAQALVIPYQKWQLPNGLILLIHEDHSDPVVHVDVTYHVGSAREVAGRSGFAHFFEHMMFQGSDNVADEEHFKIVTESGGTLNGTTNLDRTNYFETMPANQLETALWLEADRMGFFLDAVNQRKFEVQRATVKNERGQNYDNRPYGLAYEKTVEALYPPGHPYSWTTIGYLADLDAATLEDLKQFFLRWYGPNNAVLTVAGDVKPADVVRLTEKYFGSIPRGPEVNNMPPQPAKLKATRFISYEDNIRLPMLNLTWPTVEARHADEAALDVLSSILGGGKSSILYQQFIKTRKARTVRAYHPTAELAGYFQISLLALPGQSLASLYEEMMAAIASFESRGVSPEDLQRHKISVETGELTELTTVRGKATKLAYYQTFTGNANYIQKDLKRVQEVTAEDVLRVFQQYIKGKPHVALSVVPEDGGSLKAAPDNYVHQIPQLEADLSEYQNLKYNKGKDSFDRSQRPVPGPVPAVQVPKFWTETWKNGMAFIGTLYQEAPVTSIQITFPGGHYADTPEKAGRARLMASLLNEDTQKRSAEEFSDTLEMLGSSIRIYAGTEEVTIEVFTLTRNLAPTLRLLQERLMMPAFNADDFARVQQQQLEDIRTQTNNAGAVASNLLRQYMYENGIHALPDLGTENTVKSLTLEDVKAYYQTWLVPGKARVTVVSSAEQKTVQQGLQWMKDWKGVPPALPGFRTPVSQEKTRIIFFDKPGAAQSEIRVALPGLMYDATGEFFQLNLMNYPLGGAFNSRLNLNLRENKGYTYGVRSGFSGSMRTGMFAISGGFLRDATDSTLIEIFKELENFVNNGPTAEEMVFTVNAIGQRDALNYESPSQKGRFLDRMLEYDLKPDHVARQMEILKKMTQSQYQSLARKWLKTKQLLIVVVGDQEKVMPGLQKLNLPIEVVKP